MQKPTFYEQLGIIIPGSILMFGLVLYYPQLKLLTTQDAFSVGELGLFVLISYAAGHLVAAVGNGLENLFSWDGIAPDWEPHDPPGLISVVQVEKLRAEVEHRFHIT